MKPTVLLCCYWVNENKLYIHDCYSFAYTTINYKDTNSSCSLKYCTVCVLLELIVIAVKFHTEYLCTMSWHTDVCCCTEILDCCGSHSVHLGGIILSSCNEFCQLLRTTTGTWATISCSCLWSKKLCNDTIWWQKVSIADLSPFLCSALKHCDSLVVSMALSLMHLRVVHFCV